MPYEAIVSFDSVDENIVWQFKWKLTSSTFVLCCSFNIVHIKLFLGVFSCYSFAYGLGIFSSFNFVLGAVEGFVDVQHW